MAGRRRSRNGKVDEPVKLPPGPRQKTPKGGAEIPIPTKSDVFTNLQRAARQTPRDRGRSGIAPEK